MDRDKMRHVFRQGDDISALIESLITICAIISLIIFSLVVFK